MIKTGKNNVIRIGKISTKIIGKIAAGRKGSRV